jgi:hypothetical protein
MKQCAFCLRPAKMSSEHIWSEWMGRLYSGYKGTYRVNWGLGSNAKAWKSKTIDAVAKVVCEPCNNGWMSDIDDAASYTMAQMIMYGSRVSLLPLGIESIARFAYKSAVVVDCANAQHPFFSAAERKRFSEGKHDLPRGVQIWLSRIRTQHVHGRYMGHYGKIHSGKYRNFGFNVLTYTVGHLVIQLVAFRWASRVIGEPGFTPRFIQNDVFDSVSVPLWPFTSKSVLWATDKCFTEDSIHQIAERWGNVCEIASN